MSKSENKPLFVYNYPLSTGDTAKVSASETGAGQIATTRPQQRATVAIDDEWRRWVAENVLLRNEPSSIVEAMVRAGVDRATAVLEVQAAIEHPYVRAARRFQTLAPDAARSLDSKLEKRDWVLECYRRAARQATTHGKVPRTPKLSRQDFLDDYYALNPRCDDGRDGRLASDDALDCRRTQAPLRRLGCLGAGQPRARREL